MRQHGESAAGGGLDAGGPSCRTRGARYSFLPAYPRYAIARRQMSCGSGMMSYELKSGYDSAVRMMNRLKRIARAVSVGDVESLIMHPVGLARARQRGRTGAKAVTSATMDLMRLSAGLEDAYDLIDDLKQALEF
jgi:methionine-gamma-lyase